MTWSMLTPTFSPPLSVHPHVLNTRNVCHNPRLRIRTSRNQTRCCDVTDKKSGTNSNTPVSAQESSSVSSKSVPKNRQRQDNAQNDVQYHIQLLQSITEIEAKLWDEFACGGCNSPFLRHDWIRCLEQSGCATSAKGWSPSHILIRQTKRTAADSDSSLSSQSALSSDDDLQLRDENIIAIIPAYVKGHSMGEFVFDQEWADAAYGAGIMYYPKLLIAVPFTPATGRRILTRRDGADKYGESRTDILRVVAHMLVHVCNRLGVSSVHVNFCAQDEIEPLARVGFLQRKGVQYHFTNVRKGADAIAEFEKAMAREDVDMTELRMQLTNNSNDDSGDINRQMNMYRDFEDYLNEFKSKRRIKMRRERVVVREESGLQLEVIDGSKDDIDKATMKTVFEIYKSTIDKLMFGRQYLTKRFFEMLQECPDFKRHICLVLARRERDGRVIGGTFNIVGGNDEHGRPTFYGRYWGCTEEYRFLHFEACYYAAIEYCIDNGLGRMEPGAGGGEFKYMRGFEPSVTTSMHYVGDRRLANAIERYLAVESVHIDGAVEQMTKDSAIRSKTITEDDKSFIDSNED